ncbi:hypothetical protein D3C84_1100340 [compost metagenome]
MAEHLFDRLDQLQGQHAVGVGEAPLRGFGQGPLLRRTASALGRCTDASDQLGALQLLDLLARGFKGDVQQAGKVGGFQRATGLE